MQNRKPKCFLLAPDEDFALPLKRALGKKGIAIHTQFDQESDEQLSLNSYDAAIAFFENPRSDNVGDPAHRAVYFSNPKNSKGLIEAQKDGLYDFSEIQAVDLNADKIISHLKHILLNTAKTSKKQTTQGEAALAKIIGNSAQIKKVREMIQRISRFPDIPVLITGETGTGKELVANALHLGSPRAAKPLIKLNCGAIPETLFESQLFGHRKGAFSGAVAHQKGLVEEANDGVLFLDEISSLKLELQPKLLRFLEDGSYLPVGEVRECKSSAWVIAATNQDLEVLTSQGSFRADLYHRLNSTAIKLSPLRHRSDDVFILTDHFLQAFSAKHDVKSKHLNEAAKDILLSYDWSGNVRELKNLMQRLVLSPGNRILPQHISNEIKREEHCRGHQKYTSLREIEQAHILSVLKGTNYQIRTAARLLGIGRNTLKRKLAEFDLRVSPNPVIPSKEWVHLEPT